MSSIIRINLLCRPIIHLCLRLLETASFVWYFPNENLKFILRFEILCLIEIISEILRLEKSQKYKDSWNSKCLIQAAVWMKRKKTKYSRCFHKQIVWLKNNMEGQVLDFILPNKLHLYSKETLFATPLRE